MDTDLQQPGGLSRRAVLTAGLGGAAAAFAGLTVLAARPAQAATSKPLSPFASLTATGIDYSWGRPAPGVTASLGYSFVCRYLSYDTSGKNLTAGEARALIAAGLDIVLVWEDSPTGALGGYAAGAQHARDAQSMALACGMPAGRPIYFAVDFDVTPGQQTAINAYFDGAASVLGYGRTGAYGGYYPVQRLFDAGKITWGWQTYAWSGGQWESRAQLRQVQNGITVDGADCDQDQAWAADYGQWGARAAARQSQVVAIGGQGGTQSQVAAIGLDGAVYHDIRAANGVWAGWEPLDGADGASRFSATAVSLTGMSDGTSQLVAVGLDDSVHHDIRYTSGVWQGWQAMDGYDGAGVFQCA